MPHRADSAPVPVLILNCKIGGLAILRTLGVLGVPLYAVEADPRSAALSSRYCRGRFIHDYDEEHPEEYLGHVLEIGERLGGRPILIPTSDELAVFVAAYSEPLSRRFAFPRNDVAVMRQLISKKGMYELVTRHGVPTPHTLFPEHLADVRAYADGAKFPVMLKGIHGNQLQARTGKKMVIASSPEELLGSYERLEDPSRPGLMIQEYIPGSDDQIYIFNGYFDADSNCLAAFTGHKIRQYPIHVGCASLGVCRWNQTVADETVRFMKAIGYQGVLDIGYRWDPRDGRYKVLDINPRVGQAFRLFVSEDGTDVVRALYRDLTGEQIGRVVPRDGRRWVIEDYDLESSLDYFREGTLRFLPWLRSFKGLEEGAWFSWKDPVPFIRMVFALLKKTAKWTIKRLRRSDATSGS